MAKQQQSADDQFPLLSCMQLGVARGSPEAGLGATKRSLAVAVAMAMLGALALCIGISVVGMSSQANTLMPIGHWNSTVQLTQSEAKDHCKGFDHIRLSTPLHSNLGTHGPNRGDEGMVYKARDMISSGMSHDVLLTINTSNAYQAAHSEFNGVHGEFGVITMKAGSEATFTMKVLDPATLTPKNLWKRALTFFDLDQGDHGTNKEYIKVSGYSRFTLTNRTEIGVSAEANGATKFLSSKKGSGLDNPDNPSRLTLQQKNRAVTIEFQDFQEIHVTLGCTAGKHSTYFIFAVVPSLLCAETVGTIADTEDMVLSFGNPLAPTPTSGVLRSSRRSSAARSRDVVQLFIALGLCALQLW